MNLEKSHILISRTDNIGDVVLTLPIAGYLKQRYPGIRIGFLCRAYAAPLVRHCASIDYVIELEKLTDPAFWFALSGVDTVIFSKPDKRLAKAAKKAGVPNRVGTSHRWYHWLYCNRLARFSRFNSQMHEAQLNFKLLKPLGIDFSPELNEIPALYRLHVPDRCELQHELIHNKFNLIIHPKSNGNGREWPIAHYTELARLLAGQETLRIWITGSESEGQWLDRHATELLQMPNVRSVCGKFGLGELAAFIKAADGLVASGTGPMHVSAALGKPTLGLFPPLRPIDPGRWGTLGYKAQVLCGTKACARCKDAANCACMRSITPEQVADVVLHWQRDLKAPDAVAE
jgi:ADP-heptose:LPS heptosyltransferase